MTAFRPVIINNGTQSQLPNADSLLVGTGIDVSAAGALSIGGTTATSITIGSASITTDFPGPVTLTGDVTTVGGTTFTTDATFEGNVTFGDAATDTVDFVAKVDSDIIFTGDGVTPPAYKISNLADPVSAQDAATKSYVDSAIGAGAAGANTEIQFNNSGAFGASANLTFDGTTFKADSAAVFNESGAAVDFRVEGDTDANLLFVDGSADFVGIGTASPSAKLTVSGGITQSSGAVSLTADAASSFTTSSGALTLTSAAAATWSTTSGDLAVTGGAALKLTAAAGNEVVVNDAGAAVDFRVEGDTDANLLFIDGSDDNINIGSGPNDPNIKLYVNQLRTSGSGLAPVGVGVNAEISSASANDSLSSGEFFASATGGQVDDVRGLRAFASVSGTATTTNLTGIIASCTHTGAASPSYIAGIESYANVGGTNAVPYAYAVYAEVKVPAASIGEAYGVSVGAIGGAGSITNAYGLHIDGTLIAGTNAWSLYANAANPTVIKTDGSLGVNTAAPTAAFSVAEKFRVDSNGRLLEYNDAAPADGQLLIGDTAAGYWKAATLTAGTGVSITNSAGGITIDATGSGGTVTSIDVSGGTTGLTFSGGPITSSGTITMAGTLGVTNGGTGTTTQFTAGSVVFAGASGVYSQDNANLFWDDTNNRLGIGTSSPGDQLVINANANGGAVIEGDVGSGGTRALTIANNTTGNGRAGLYLTNDGTTGRYFEITYHSRAYVSVDLQVADQATFLSAGAGGALFGTFPTAQPAGDVIFVRGGTSAPNQRLNLKASEVSVNEDGQNVDFRVEGDTDANLIFVDASADQVGIGTSSPNEKLTVNGKLSLAEGTAPSATAAFGKLWANSAADARPYWLDDTGQSYNLTLDRFNTLTAGATVTVDTSPALPQFNTVTLNQATTFTTSSLGNGRSASVRVVCDGTTRALTWPAGWTWLGSGAPTSIAANDVGYLSIVAFGATDNDVVAGWSYENSPVSVTGSGVDNQIAVWSGTYSQDGSATLTFDGTTFSADSAAVFNESGAAVDFRVEGDTDANLLFVDGSADFVGIGTASPSAKLTVSGGLTQSSGAVSLTGNAASSLTTSSGALTLTSAAAATWSTSAGALTLTSAAAATWSTAAGNLAISGAANLELTAGSGSAVVVNEAGADVDLRVESDNNANMLLVDASADAVAIGTTGVTHTFNIGSGSSVGFAVASGGRIHTYDGSNPTDGQILIGDTALGNFAKATLTAGTGVSVTNGAGAITLAATGTVPLTTTGLTAGDVCYASSNSTGGAAVATAASTSRVLGFVATVGGPGTIQVTGIYTGANFITGLTGLAAGQPVYLSKTSGKLTNDVSAFTTNDVVAEIGIAVNVSSATGGAAAADVLIQPKSIVVL